jgi:hypothetical protein
MSLIATYGEGTLDQMTAKRLRRGGIAASLAWMSLLVITACYQPDLTNGGLQCSAGKCPEGYTCSDRDNHCWRPGTGPSTTGDGGGSDVVCTNPPVTPICAEAPTAGTRCNPSCQTGCECGRCNIVGKVADCVPAGVKTLGQTCNPAADDCAPGFICLQEACGGGTLGRCYKHCATTDQCGGTICQIPIQDSTGNDTGYRACDVAPQTCDPIAKTGCPAPALNCYVSGSSTTVCDCPNRPADMGGLDAACTIYSDCAPGLVCVSTGPGGARCRPLCLIAAPACNNCIASGLGKYGYCGP